MVLWVAEKDAPLLTPEIRSLEDQGLTIAVCPDDLRSYNKLFHSLTTYPYAFVLTADDDVYYWSTWAEELAAKFQSAEIVECHRCHKITLDDAGLPRPYAEWEQELSAPDIGPLVFPTGNGGVLYPPAPFGPEFFSIDKLRELSPLADDIWIYWMGRRNGRLFCQIGTRRRFWNWEDSQNVSLMSANLGAAGGNDRQLNNLISEYSWPPASQ